MWQHLNVFIMWFLLSLAEHYSSTGEGIIIIVFFYSGSRIFWKNLNRIILKVKTFPNYEVSNSNYVLNIMCLSNIKSSL